VSAAVEKPAGVDRGDFGFFLEHRDQEFGRAADPLADVDQNAVAVAKESALQGLEEPAEADGRGRPDPDGAFERHQAGDERSGVLVEGEDLPAAFPHERGQDGIGLGKARGQGGDAGPGIVVDRVCFFPALGVFLFLRFRPSRGHGGATAGLGKNEAGHPAAQPDRGEVPAALGDSHRAGPPAQGLDIHGRELAEQTDPFEHHRLLRLDPHRIEIAPGQGHLMFPGEGHGDFLGQGVVAFHPEDVLPEAADFGRLGQGCVLRDEGVEGDSGGRQVPGIGHGRVAGAGGDEVLDAVFLENAGDDRAGEVLERPGRVVVVLAVGEDLAADLEAPAGVLLEEFPPVDRDEALAGGDDVFSVVDRKDVEIAPHARKAVGRPAEEVANLGGRGPVNDVGPVAAAFGAALPGLEPRAESVDFGSAEDATQDEFLPQGARPRYFSLLRWLWSPHSSFPFPAHRPDRSSLPGSDLEVQHGGKHPMEAYPCSYNGFVGRRCFSM